MDWLFELSVAGALVALALPFAWKPPRPALARVRVSPPRPPSADKDFRS
jgi:hypothetical protein